MNTKVILQVAYIHVSCIIGHLLALSESHTHAHAHTHAHTRTRTHTHTSNHSTQLCVSAQVIHYLLDCYAFLLWYVRVQNTGRPHTNASTFRRTEKAYVMLGIEANYWYVHIMCFTHAAACTLLVSACGLGVMSILVHVCSVHFAVEPL